jgi:hypothetical protein
METVLIISADKWQFTDEKTGELRNGATIQYVNDYREDTDVSVGFKPIKTSVNDAVFDAIKKSGAPAMYRLDSRSRPGKDNKPTLTVVSAQFVKPVKLFEAA